MKELLFNNNIRNKLFEGVEILNNAVKITLGPKGRNVIIEKEFTMPLITKDGVTVAKEIDLKDKYNNLGVQILKEVALKTNENAGDGTTTATILAYSMIKEGMKYVNSGINIMDLKKGIDIAIFRIIYELNKITRICTKNEEIFQIATVSANNDIEIGSFISKAIEKIGKEGVITIEESKSTNTSLEIVEGLKIDKGYLSSYFINDIDKQATILENPFILIYNKKLTNIKVLINVIELISRSNRSLLIMLEDIDNEILNTLILNNIKGNIKISPIKLPGFGDKRKDILGDIATITGGVIVTDELGISLDNISISDLGQAKKVEIYKNYTIFIGGAGINSEISKRIRNISNQIINCKSDYEKEKFQERLSNLSNGIAIIKVGSSTESELKEKKSRVEDSLNSVKVALQEGYIPGSGIPLLKIKKYLNKFIKSDNDDQNIGIKIVLKAIEEPIKQILINAEEDINEIISNIIKNKNINNGYDIIKKEYCNLINKGILDPLKTTRAALQNAASVSTLILTTNVGIIDISKNKEDSENDNEIDDDIDV